MPSITGQVVFVDLTKVVTASLTDSEIAEIVSTAEDTFGVYPGNVAAEVTYDITGTIAITADSDVSDEEIISALQTSIADALNVHSSDVEITIDSDTGVATYTINSATAEDAAALQDALQFTSTNDAIATAVSSAIPAVSDVKLSLHFVS